MSKEKKPISNEHMWFPWIPRGTPKEQKIHIDDMLGDGRLDDDFVYRRINNYIRAASNTPDDVKYHFEKRLEEWYPKAVKKYKASLS